MKPIAIVYSSNTGYTQRYAQMLSEALDLPIFTLKEAKKKIKKDSPIIYMSWLMAGRVKDYSKARRRYDLKSVIAVCLGPTGSQLDSVIKNCGLNESFPAFTIQGGMDREKLKGINKMMINMLVKMLSSAKNKKPEDEAMLEMIIKGGDFVSRDKLEAVLSWYKTVS